MITRCWQEFPDNQEGIYGPGTPKIPTPAGHPGEATECAQPEATSAAPTPAGHPGGGTDRVQAEAAQPEATALAAPASATPVPGQAACAATPEAAPLQTEAKATAPDVAEAEAKAAEPGQQNGGAEPGSTVAGPEATSPMAAVPGGVPDWTLELAGLQALMKNQHNREMIQGQLALQNAQQHMEQHPVTNTGPSTVNWTTHKREGMRLKRLMEESAEGSKFPHMVRLWNSGAAVSWCPINLVYHIFLFKMYAWVSWY